MHTGIATFSLDYGRCPKWLFERMKKLAGIIAEAIITEFGPEEFLKRIADPVWFQSFGCVLAFDWNSSGLTVTTLAALKEALKERFQELGIFVCGGKGKTSKKTPEEIKNYQRIAGFDSQIAEKLINYSKGSAKVDNNLIQDGFQIYHHTFIFTKNFNWAVIQQGMNTQLGQARRYHWLGNLSTSLIDEKNQTIVADEIFKEVLNLISKRSEENRKISLELALDQKTFYRDLKILTNKTTFQKQLKILELPDLEFKSHPVVFENFNLERIQKNLKITKLMSPSSFSDFILLPQIGPKTIRALSLVAEIIYGAKPSYQDPARYSFAHGGKDATPFPVDLKTYDKTIEIMSQAVRSASLSLKEKELTLRKLEKFFVQQGGRL